MHATDQREHPLLSIRDLAVRFDGSDTPAVDGNALTLYPRQTVAMVGESGCGKSVSAMSVLRLNPSPPARYERGSIVLRTPRHPGGIDLLRVPNRDLRAVRGGEVAMIFQEPMTSLNPVFTIGDQIAEAVREHQGVGAREAKRRAATALRDVGIPDPERRVDEYPHRFSGGMRQRVMIAMALACEPAVLIADEPTTALDVTIQAQILALLRDLQCARGLGIVLITHDLGIVAGNADVVSVMYAGRVVEYASVFDLFERPRHPYTRGLLSAIPRADRPRERLATIRDVIGDASSFTPIPGVGAGPWWPGHEPPGDLRSGPTSLLVEAEPGHWVAVWNTPRVDPARATPPDLSFCRPVHAGPLAKEQPLGA